MEWYWIALISAGWIALCIVYLYAGDKLMGRMKNNRPTSERKEFWVWLGFVIGIALIYLSWPVVIPVFGLIDVSWGWWALMAAEVVCFPIFIAQNDYIVIRPNEKRLEAMPKVLALIVSVIACGLMLVFSPLLLLGANWGT